MLMVLRFWRLRLFGIYQSIATCAHANCNRGWSSHTRSCTFSMLEDLSGIWNREEDELLEKLEREDARNTGELT